VETVTAKLTIASVGVAALVAVTTWAMGWPFERAALLAPVLVICVLVIAGLLLFWGKVAAAQLRETRRPRFWLAVWVGGILLIVLLTVLGVNLPRE
jgi:hypothetical protein